MGEVTSIRVTPREILTEQLEEVDSLKNIVVISQGPNGTRVLHNHIDLGQLVLLGRLFQLHVDDIIVGCLEE